MMSSDIDMSNMARPLPAGASFEPQRAPGTDELKNLLSVIADQISQADRRHTDVLYEMRERLTTLSEDTRAVRTQVAGDLGPVFNRIEDALTQLAERMGEGAGPASRATSQPAAAEPDEALPRPVTQLAPAHPAVAPAVLRSASTHSVPQVFARPSDPPRAQSVADVDPFDVVDVSVPHGSSEPWDEEQAEALARVYDEPQHAPAADHPAQDLRSSPSPVAYFHTEAQPGHGNGAGTSADSDAHQADRLERAWLEGKFAEIADRIEQSLATLAPESPLEGLTQRFDEFEHRFSEALHDVAARADMTGLRTLEGQIADLAGHIEQAHQQLGRLDLIEHQIGTVIEQIAEARAPVPAAQPMPDHSEMERVAQIAAEQVAQRFAGSLTSHDNGEGAEVRHLLESFISERRQGEEQTMTMLDTLQQALIRVLDRVDAIEAAQSTQRPMIQAAPVQPSAARGYQQASLDASADFAEELGRTSPLGAGHNDFDLAEDAHDPSLDFQDFGGHGESGTFDPDHEETQAAALPDLPPLEPMPEWPQMAGATQQPQSQPQSAKSAIERLRQDFIADAQRAKAKASAAAVQSEADAVSLKPASKGVRGVLGAANAKAGESQPLSPKLKAIAIVTAIAIAIGAGGVMMVNSGSSAPEAPAVVVEEPMDVTPQGAAPAQPAAEAVAPSSTQAPAATQAPAQPPAAAQQPGTPPVAAPQAQKPAAAGTSTAPKLAPKPQQRSDAANEAAPDVAQGPAFETDEGGTGAASAADAVDPDSIPGLRVQVSDKLPSADDFQRIRQQQGLAKLSHDVGAKTSELMTPAAFLADAPKAQPVAEPVAPTFTSASPLETGSTGAANASAALELPPATVGPLSLRLAAARGDASAQFEVGARLAEGKGTNQNFTEAIRWYQRSAAQGFAQSQYRLGTLYERGLGVKADVAIARDWYLRAAEQGNVKAMHNLAVLSAAGGTGGPDYSTASTWFAKAAEHGLKDSQYNLGVLYESGLGLEKSIAEAYKWYAIAAASGDKDALRRRDAAKAQLSTAELAESDAVVANFTPATTDRLANDARAAGEDWKKRDHADTNG